MVEQQEEQRSEQGSGGVTGAGFRKDEPRTRLLAHQGAAASVQSRRLRSETRALAEEGFREAVSVLMEQLAYWVGKREEALTKGKEPSRVVENRVLVVASELAKATKHVLPLSVQADIVTRAELPIIPPEILAALKAVAPTREELAALEAGVEAAASDQDEARQSRRPQ